MMLYTLNQIKLLNFDHHLLPSFKINRPKLFILSTDGLRDSLQGEMSQFERVCRWVNQRLKNEGWEQVKADMPNWLTQLSERGNGDDATMGIVAWNMEREHEQIV